MSLYPHKLTRGLKTREIGQSWWLELWVLFGCFLACLLVCLNGYEMISYMFIEVAHDSECRKERKIIINVPYKILPIILCKHMSFSLSSLLLLSYQD